MKISVEQMRAARGLLNWSAEQLATEAGVGAATIRRFESGATESLANLQEKAVMTAFEKAGIVFIEPGETVSGVALKNGVGQRDLKSRRK